MDGAASFASSFTSTTTECTRLLPDELKLHHLPLKDVLWMGQQVHVWSCRLRREDQCHRQDITNAEYNHSIRVKSMALADAHSLACDMSIQRNAEIIAYTLLEVTFDLHMVMSRADEQDHVDSLQSSAQSCGYRVQRSKQMHHGTSAQVAPSTRMHRRPPRTSRCTCSISGCTPGTTMSFPTSSTWTYKFKNFYLCQKPDIESRRASMTQGVQTKMPQSVSSDLRLVFCCKGLGFR